MLCARRYTTVVGGAYNALSSQNARRGYEFASNSRLRAIPMKRRQPNTVTWLCSSCNTRKRVERFNKASNTASGFTQPCARCELASNRIRNRAWRKQNRRRVLQINRAYQRRHRAVLRARASARARANPLKATARRVLYFAVRWGFIKKPARCSNCGAKRRRRLIQAHHADYSKPTKVLWLCSHCHGLRHRKAA